MKQSLERQLKNLEMIGDQPGSTKGDVPIDQVATDILGGTPGTADQKTAARANQTPAQ